MARRPRRTEHAALLAACALLAAPIAGGAQAPSASFAASSVLATITISAGGHAAVHARLASPGNIGALDFQYLSVPCAIVGPVHVRLAGTDIALSTSDRSPWVLLRAAPGASRAHGPAQVDIYYDVELSGREVSVPVVHPAMPIRALDGYGARLVQVDVSFEGSDDARVILPQLQASRSGPWTGRFLAFPSIVRVDRGSMSSAVTCEAPRAKAGDAGRFEFIFFSFIATVALWVPLYLWWVSRQRDAAGPDEG